MALYKNQYRVESARLKGWDYSSPGVYFTTLVTMHRRCYFGHISDGELVLNALGQVAWNYFHQVPHHFSFVGVDTCIVMPNHVHGIIVINEGKTPETQDIASLPPKCSYRVSSNQFGPQSNNLPSIVRGYKIGVSNYARNKNIPFKWQKRYYDHIIRNGQEWNRTREYILTNPKRWAKDRENPDHMGK